MDETNMEAAIKLVLLIALFCAPVPVLCIYLCIEILGILLLLIGAFYVFCIKAPGYVAIFVIVLVGLCVYIWKAMRR